MKRRLSLVVIFLAYAAALGWVLFRPIGPAPGDDRQVVRMVHWQLESSLREAFEAQAARYMELNPDVRVEIVVVPGRIYLQWLRSQLVGGTATDLVEFGTFLPGMKDLVPRFFQPITPWVSRPNPYNVGTSQEGVPWRETFRDQMQGPDGFHRDLNHYYAATLCSVNVRLFYNRELLRELAGVDTPPDDLEAFFDLCARLEAAGEARGISPIASGKLNTRWTFDNISRGMLSRFAVAHNRHYSLYTPPRDIAMAYLRGEWRHDHPGGPREQLELGRDFARYMRPGYLQLDRDDAVQIFLREQAVFIGTGTWDAPSLRLLAPFDVGVARFPFPQSDHPRYGHLPLGELSDGAVGTAVPFYVNKDTPHPELAIDLLQFMTSVEGNQIFTDVSSWYPSINGVIPSDNDPNFAPNYEGVALSESISRLSGANAELAWDRHLHRLYGANGSVEQFAAAIERDLTTAIRQDLLREHRESLLQLRRLEPALLSQLMLEARRPAPDGDQQVASDALLAGQVPYEINTLELAEDLRDIGALP
jgi:raffinose/stachyose/melibiose transport system substrate-binding protein